MVNRMRAPSALPVLAALVLAGCGTTADLDIDRACATTPQQTLPGVVGAAGADTLPPATVAFDLGTVVPDLQKRGLQELRTPFLSLEVSASRSVAFLRTLVVRALPPAGSTLPARTLGTYQRPAGGAPVDSLTLAGDGSDLAGYLTGDRLLLEISGTGDPGQLPPQSWTVDAKVCVGVHAVVDWWDAATGG
jgi:hypothetical protein